MKYTSWLTLSLLWWFFVWNSSQVVLGDNLVEVAAVNGLDDFLAIGDETGQDQYWVLEDDVPLTLFAPSNDAFAAISDSTMECLRTLNNGKSATLLDDILKYHVVYGTAINTTDIQDGTSALSVLRAPIQFNVDPGSGNIIINTVATIIDADLQADNGIIQVIDTVLIPPGMNLTLLCPEDTSTNNPNWNTGTNSPNNNGTTTSTNPPSTTTTTTASSETVLNVLGANGLNTVAEIAVATGQDKFWTGDVPMTLFAPSEEAFASLPNGTMDCLKTLGYQQGGPLDAILANHVVLDNKVWMSRNITDGTTLTSVTGEPLTFSVDSSSTGTIQINNKEATIIEADLKANNNNAVIHVIDHVLIPSFLDLNQLCPNTNTNNNSANQQDGDSSPTPASASSPTSTPTTAPSSSTGNSQENEMDIATTIATNQDTYSLSTLASLVEMSGGDFAVNPLGSGRNGPVTMFGPTDAAFAALNVTYPGLLDEIINSGDVTTIQTILANHVVETNVPVQALEQGLRQVTSLEGEILNFSYPPPMVNDANFVTTDISCLNGLLQTIDKVLLPSSLVPSPTTDTSNNNNNNNNNDRRRRRRRRRLMEGDISTTTTAPTASPTNNSTSSLLDDTNVDDLPGIVDIANSTGQFSFLLQALENAGLGSVLDNPGPFTVFAPTDDAIQELPNLNQFLNNITISLPLVMSHVVPGMYTTEDLVGGTILPTLGDTTITIKREGMDVYVNDVLVVEPDLIGSNGVIQAIDKVLFTN